MSFFSKKLNIIRKKQLNDITFNIKNYIELTPEMIINLNNMSESEKMIIIKTFNEVTKILVENILSFPEINNKDNKDNTI